MSKVPESMKKSGMMWLDLPGDNWARATWCHWRGDFAYVIAHHPPPSAQMLAIVRDKQTGAAHTWLGSASIVQPGSAEWTEVVPEINASRLNSPPVTEQTLILRLDPTEQD